MKWFYRIMIVLNILLCILTVFNIGLSIQFNEVSGIILSSLELLIHIVLIGVCAYMLKEM